MKYTISIILIILTIVSCIKPKRLDTSIRGPYIIEKRDCVGDRCLILLERMNIVYEINMKDIFKDDKFWVYIQTIEQDGKICVVGKGVDPIMNRVPFGCLKLSRKEPKNIFSKVKRYRIKSDSSK